MRALELRLVAALCLVPWSVQPGHCQEVGEVCRLLRSPLLEARGYTAGQPVPLSRHVGIGALGNRVPFIYSGCFYGNEAAAAAFDRLLGPHGTRADTPGPGGSPAPQGAGLVIQSFSDEEALAREHESSLQDATLDLPQAAPADTLDGPLGAVPDPPVATLLYPGGACGTWDQPPAPALAARREIACSLTRGRHEIGLSVFDVLPERLPTLQQVKDLLDAIAARLD